MTIMTTTTTTSMTTTSRRIFQRLARQRRVCAPDASSSITSAWSTFQLSPWRIQQQSVATLSPFRNSQWPQQHHHPNHRCLSSSSSSSSSSPFDPTNHAVKGQNQNNNYPNNDKHSYSSPQQQRQRRRQRALKLVPLKPAVALTAQARVFFRQLLQNPPRPDICGVRLNYGQPASGEPRMVFSFAFVTPQELEPFDEAVPLTDAAATDPETANDGENETTEETTTTKPPTLYVSGNAFLKVLGAMVDVDQNFTPVLYDKEGNRMDPNA